MPDAFQFDTQDPLAQCEGESDRANAALRDYAHMGAGRSLRRLAKRYASVPQTEAPPTRSAGTVSGWSVRYAWQARIAVWTQIDQQEEEDEWKARRARIRADAWQDYEQLIELCRQITAAGPTFVRRTQRVVDEGKPSIIGPGGEVLHAGSPRQVVITLALDTVALSRLRKVASELATQASADLDDALASGVILHIVRDRDDTSNGSSA